MKRVVPHLLFWFCYYMLYACMAVLWDKGAFPNWPVGHLIKVSLTGAMLDLAPQMIFSYYLIYYGTNNIVKKKGGLWVNIFEIVAVFFLCILLARCLTNYIELPYLYKALILKKPLFKIERIFGEVLIIGFASGCMISVTSVRNQLAAKEREKNLTKEKLETELKFLRSQTNPHFLLNTLNNIYALARRKSDDTAEAVMRLSELLRFVLYESNNNLIKLTDEIKFLEDYLELETLRYSERLTISFHKEVDNKAYEIAPLLLLPFLENAFKHGISETRFESYLNIDITAKNGWLRFEIENNKDEYYSDKLINKIGLDNVRRRLELTYKEYKLDVQNLAAVFKINLSVNINSYVKI